MWSVEDVFFPLNTLLARELTPSVEGIEGYQQMFWVESSPSVC